MLLCSVRPLLTLAMSLILEVISFHAFPNDSVLIRFILLLLHCFKKIINSIFRGCWTFIFPPILPPNKSDWLQFFFNDKLCFQLHPPIHIENVVLTSLVINSSATLFLSEELPSKKVWIATISVCQIIIAAQSKSYTDKAWKSKFVYNTNYFFLVKKFTKTFILSKQRGSFFPFEVFLRHSATVFRFHVG